jgi:dihydroorotase
MRFLTRTLRLTVVFWMASYAVAQPAVQPAPQSAGDPAYDLLLQGGHLIDAKSNLSAIRDVGIKDGVIVAVAVHLDPAAALKVVNLSGLYVTPGLIDIHVHVFAGTGERGSYAGDLSLYPDGFTSAPV